MLKAQGLEPSTCCGRRERLDKGVFLIGIMVTATYGEA